MTTRYIIGSLPNCGSYGNVIFTRGNLIGSNSYSGYYTFSNPDAQDGETRRLLCVESNAFILFAVCGTHLANGSGSETARGHQMAQFVYIAGAYSSYGTVIGGDLNDDPLDADLDPYYIVWYEADNSNRVSPQSTPAVHRK